MLNNVPIYLYIKKQDCIETSTFGSEFMATEQTFEYLQSLRYKLGIFGVPVEELTFIYDDNQSAFVNSSVSKSTLKNKSQSIAFHFICEVCARSEWGTSYIHAFLKLADMLTNSL